MADGKPEDLRAEWHGISDLGQGGLLNLLDINSPTELSFSEAALVDLSRAIRFDPKDDPALYLERYLAETHFLNRRPKLRVESSRVYFPSQWYLLHGLDFGKADPDFLLGAAKELSYVKSAEQTAIALIGRGLLLSPQNPLAKELRAWRDTALKSLSSPALATPPPGAPKTAREWKDRGNAFSAGNDWRGALECYDRALALDPTFADAHNNRGSVLLERSCTDLAIHALTRAIALDPKHKLAYARRAEAWRMAWQPEKAAAGHREGPSAGDNAHTPRHSLHAPRPARARPLRASVRI